MVQCVQKFRGRKGNVGDSDVAMAKSILRCNGS